MAESTEKVEVTGKPVGADESPIKETNAAGDPVIAPDEGTAKEIQAIDARTQAKKESDDAVAQAALDEANKHAVTPPKEKVQAYQNGAPHPENRKPVLDPAVAKAVNSDGEYTMVAGESLLDVATRYGIGYADLRERNALVTGADGNLAGTVIRLYPKGATV